MRRHALLFTLLLGSPALADDLPPIPEGAPPPADLGAGRIMMMMHKPHHGPSELFKMLHPTPVAPGIPKK